jgi:hypothetical protein
VRAKERREEREKKGSGDSSTKANTHRVLKQTLCGNREYLSRRMTCEEMLAYNRNRDHREEEEEGEERLKG